jgi:AcrR family transcriptional regulator
MRTVDPTRHEEKRRQILEAAERCFARSGFRGASISDICAEAGMSPGHLYHYFDGKEAIIGAMTESGLKYVAGRVAEMAAQEDLLQALQSELRKTKSKRERAKAALMQEMVAEAGRNRTIATIVQQHHCGLRDLVAAYIRAGQERGQVDQTLDPELAAAILISVLDGAGSLSLKDPALDLPRAMDMLSTLISRFLSPP